MERTRKRSLRKKRLGILVDSLETPYQQEIVRGAAAAADNAGAALLCFAGGALRERGEGGDARCRVYELVSPRSLDAAILCSGTLIGCTGGASRCGRFNSLPLCAIGAELEGHISLLIDNESGIRKLVEHLITQHASRHLAFVRGPLHNDDAELRLEAYRQVLAAHHLPFRPDLVVLGDFMEGGGTQAVERLARTLGAEFDRIDTIVASNDNMAIGAMSALHAMGVTIPQKKRITGFDDIDEARLTQPQLSTVRQPLIGQGQTAVKLIMEGLQMGASRQRVCLETELVLRRSCGCDAVQRVGEYSAPPPGGFAFAAGVVVRRNKIIDAMTRAAQGDFSPAGSDWQHRLLNALLIDMQNGQPDGFPRTVQDLLEKLGARGVDLGTCHAVFDALREKMVPALRNDSEARDRAEDLLRAASRVTDDTILRHSRREQLRSSYSARTISVVCSAISTSFERNQLIETLHSGLPRMGVTRALVVVYPPDAPRLSEVLSSYGHDAGGEPLSGLRFDRQLAVPSEYDLDETKGCHFCLPLFVGTRVLGHVILQQEVDFGYAFDAIAAAVSCALHGCDLQKSGGTG